MKSIRFPFLPPLDALIAFEAAAEHQSFTRAGNELYLTASAIAHQVKKLEASLGRELFTRKAKGIVLNSQGHEYLVFVRQTLKQLETCSEGVRNNSLKPVKILTQHAIAQFWLQPRLVEYQRRFGEVEIEITATTRIPSVPEDTDIAICYFDSPPGGGWQPLWKEYLLAVCHPEYQAEAPVLYYDRDWWDDWNHWVSGNGFMGAEPDKRRRSSLYALVVQSVLDGLGIMVGRKSLIQAELDAGRLRAWPDNKGEPVPAGGYYLNRSAEGLESIAVNEFCRGLVALCSDDAG